MQIKEVISFQEGVYIYLIIFLHYIFLTKESLFVNIDSYLFFF